MAYTPPWQRLCDCRCPQHHGYQRATYNDERCACAITCTTQPTTLITEHWNCALFFDHGEELWLVTRLPGGQWDWLNADHIHEHHEYYDASLIIERQLRQIINILRNPYEQRRQA